jgi:FMN reductase
MLGGGPSHALAPELSLRPLLTELGAVVPVAGLYVVDSRYDQPEAYADWLATARPVLHRFLAHPLLEGVS